MLRAHHFLIKTVSRHLGDLISPKLIRLLYGGKAYLVLVDFHRDRHLCFTGSVPASSFPHGCTEGGIVSLNEAGVPVGGSLLFHDLTGCMAHGPDRIRRLRHLAGTQH